MRVGSLRIAIVAAWLVVFSNGVLFLLARRIFDLPGTWDGPVLRPAIVLSIAVAVALVALDGQRVSGARLRPVPVVPLAAAIGLGAWAAISTWWSLEPEVTLWRGLGYAFLPFVAWVIADLSARDLRRALGVGAGLLVSVGVCLALLHPRWGTDFNGDWRGLMTNRNGFAPICSLAVIAGVSLVVEGRRGGGGALLGLGAIGLVGSGSRTAAVALAVALAVATGVVMARSAHLERPRRAVVLVAASGVVAGLALSALLARRLWGEPTLAQRREIWELVGGHIVEAPMIGKGWAAFWHHPPLLTDPLLQRGSAHGSVPELLLGGGAVALGLWLLVVGHAVLGVGRVVWRSPDNEAWLWLALVVFLLVENLTESFVLWFSYNWILLIAAALRFGPSGSGWRVRAGSAVWSADPPPERLAEAPKEEAAEAKG